MVKFKPGDRVRMKPDSLSWGNCSYCSLHYGGETEFTLREYVGETDTWLFEGYSAASYPSRFELIPQEPEKDPHLPLTFILEMDRVLAQAAVKVDTLNTYLDKPLSDFIRDVMEPNYLSLKFGA